ncbi:MAG: DUF4832 domain-containing protein [Clostridiales bacterium]|nr:DUF4832 domain-containing protein [Clostridiales bacterium]
MKRLLSIFLVAATLACLFSFQAGAATISGLRDSGIDYHESTRTIANPMVGYSATVTMAPKVSGNTPGNYEGFVFFYVNLQNFSGGYQLTEDGRRIPLTEAQKNDRVNGNANALWDWNLQGGEPQRNHGGPEDIPISEDAINCFRETFQNLRNNGGTGYVRFNYANNADVHNEPCDFNIILTHIKQISALITEFSDVIGMAEVGTIGPFGEMHTSPYCAAEYANPIIDTYLANTPADVKFLVRTPNYIMNYLCYKSSGEDGIIYLKDGTKKPVMQVGPGRFSNFVPFDNIKGIEQADMKRISLFNDGYMLTGNDTGTWYDRKTGVEWLAWATQYNYYGGEYGSGDRLEDFWLPETALPEMYETHVNYIRGNIYRSTMNGVNTWITRKGAGAEAYVQKLYEDSLTISKDDPNGAVLDLGTVDISGNDGRIQFNKFGYDMIPFTKELAEASCKADVSAYYGFSCYSFIRDHLGYRFVIRDSKCTGQVDKGGVLQIQTSIENTGMGNCIQNKTAQLVLAKDGEEIAAIPLNKKVDANAWYSQETTSFTVETTLASDMEAGEYDAYLRICNVTSDGKPNTKTCVEFANAGEIYDQTLRANYLGSFTVTDTVSSLGNTGFKQVSTVFDDLDGHWGKTQIQEICSRGLMSGTSYTRFAPDESTTRAMIVQVLYNLEGRPSVEGISINFKDVGANEWYTDAIKWASANKIAFGYNNQFEPNDTLLREEFAAFLYRYARYKGTDAVSDLADMSKYSDFETATLYAHEALRWANTKRFITGHDNGLLDPLGDATRAQLASIVSRYISDQNKA